MNKFEILQALKAGNLWQELNNRTKDMGHQEMIVFMNDVTNLLENLRAEGRVAFTDSLLIDGCKLPPFSIKLLAKPWWKFW